MGEAKDIVQGPTRPEAKGPAQGANVLVQLRATIDDVDRAVQAKQKDVKSEPDQLDENVLKLGQLQTAKQLLMQARAVLEDYGYRIDEDLRAATLKTVNADGIAMVAPKPELPDWAKVGAMLVDGDGIVWEIVGLNNDVKNAVLRTCNRRGNKEEQHRSYSELRHDCQHFEAPDWLDAGAIAMDDDENEVEVDDFDSFWVTVVNTACDDEEFRMPIARFFDRYTGIRDADGDPITKKYKEKEDAPIPPGTF